MPSLPVTCTIMQRYAGATRLLKQLMAHGTLKPCTWHCKIWRVLMGIMGQSPLPFRGLVKGRFCTATANTPRWKHSMYWKYIHVCWMSETLLAALNLFAGWQKTTDLLQLLMTVAFNVLWRWVDLDTTSHWRTPFHATSRMCSSGFVSVLQRHSR